MATTKPKIDRTKYIIDNKKGEFLFKKPGEVDGFNFKIRNLEDCTVYLFDWTNGMFIDDCTNCKIIAGPCDGSLFIRGCKNCTVSVASNQLRYRDCENVRSYVYTTSDPVIENSTLMSFGPYNSLFPKLGEIFKKAKFSENENKYNLVYDFSQDKVIKDQKHWDLMTPEDFQVEEVKIDEDESPVEPLYDEYLKEIEFFTKNALDLKQKFNFDEDVEFKEENPINNQRNNEVDQEESAEMANYQNLFDDVNQQPEIQKEEVAEINNAKEPNNFMQENKPEEERNLTEEPVEGLSDYENFFNAKEDSNITEKRQQNIVPEPDNDNKDAHNDFLNQSNNEHNEDKQAANDFNLFHNASQSRQEISKEQDFFNPEEGMIKSEKNIKEDLQMMQQDEQIDDQEQRALLKREQEKEERIAKLRQVFREEMAEKTKIREKAHEYRLKFKEERKKKLEQRQKQNRLEEENTLRDRKEKVVSNPWDRVLENVDIRSSNYKGTKDVEKMRNLIIMRRDDFRKKLTN